MQYGQNLCTVVRVSRRKQRRRSEKAKRHGPSAPAPIRYAATRVRDATNVERLAYTRTQAAEALGVSPTTLSRRVLPLIETIDMPWGPKLIPVDELERFVTEHRRSARGRPPTAPPGRPAVVPHELVRHIRAEHAEGKSLRQIARDLNAAQTPTAHGGVQWWPSTVRSVLIRAEVAARPGADPSDLCPVTPCHGEHRGLDHVSLSRSYESPEARLGATPLSAPGDAELVPEVAEPWSYFPDRLLQTRSAEQELVSVIAAPT
jgi:hypothetical protein